MSGPEILTRRLRLSPLSAEDVTAFFGYRSDPAVRKYQSFEPGSVEETVQFVDALQDVAFDKSGYWYQFGVHLRELDRLVGDIGVHFVAADSRQAEIGFTIAPSHQGQGFGTEAVSGMLDLLLGDLQKHRVFASVDPRNAPSIALLERVGMRKEAHFRESLWLGGEWVDDVVFGILRSEWCAGRDS